VIRLVGLDISAGEVQHSADVTSDIFKRLKDWSTRTTVAASMGDDCVGAENLSELFVKVIGKPTSGWEIGEDAQHEFFTLQQVPSDMWRMTEANLKYELCPSYPSRLVVPKCADDHLLFRAASQRSKRRLPVLTYYHAKRGSALLRCSQPVGSSDLDTQYLDLCRQAVGRQAQLHIFDCRSHLASFANRLMGGGTEAAEAYVAGTEMPGDNVFAAVRTLDVPNLHEMRSSWQTLQDLVNRTDVPESKWLQLLGHTNWLDHCRRITEAASTVARVLVSGHSATCVVVHCSDGWDRTSQVCALVQLFVDKRFRTRQGLCELVEKDWRRFGHKFADRGNPKHPEASPIFLQWLFCVGAVVAQFPDDFDYNSNDLMLLADLSMSRAFGTMMFNNERESREADASKTHVSIWSIWFGSHVTSVVREMEPSEKSKAMRRSVTSPATLAKVMLDEQDTGAETVCDSDGLRIPVTSLKRFVLWEWALRFDEIGFSDELSGQDSGRHHQQVLGKSPVLMLRNSSCSECMGCHLEFGAMRWRHHCRGCGRLFCHTCVHWRLQVWAVAGKISCESDHHTRRKVRVCQRCFFLGQAFLDSK